MDCFDKLEEFLLAEGYAKEEIPAIMVSLVEQGMSPWEVMARGVMGMGDMSLPWLSGADRVLKQKKVEPKPRRATRIPGAATGQAAKPTGSLRSGNLSFPGDRSGAYDAAKQKLSTPKVEVPKIKTPPQTGGLLGTRSVPTMKDLGATEKPAWTGSSGSGQGFPKPPRVPRDAGAFARQKMLLKPPAPTAPTGIFGRLKNIRGTTPAQLVVNLAAGEALDRYVTQPIARAGGNALARGILDATGKGEKARQVNPQLYGKSGPTLTPEIVKAVQQRSKLAQQRAETQAASQPKPTETGERSAAANDTKQQAAKLAAQQKRVAAAKPAPAPKPKPVRQTGDKAKDESTWRSANTRLSRVADMRKEGESREEINKVLYNKGTRAYGAK